MQFNIADFTRTNKVVLIWAAFAALLYIFRDMFGLVFITYILCFVTYSLLELLPRPLKSHRRLMIVVIYLFFLLLIGGALFFLAPRLLVEARNFGEQIPTALGTIESWVEAKAPDNDLMAQALYQIEQLFTPEQLLLRGWAIGRGLLDMGLHYVSWFLLGLMFSFLIMMDLPHLVRSVRGLRATRFASIYEETADSVVLFARVVGENFRAQLLISAVNTLLTAIGMYALGLNAAALLSTLVFLCGLVPVLGVFLSSVPIVLMAVNSGGIALGLWAVLMIFAVHIVEAYFLNPRIVSAVMRINPVMTLIILYIAHSLMGLWGMLLGVPIAVYIYRQLIAPVPVKALPAVEPR